MSRCGGLAKQNITERVRQAAKTRVSRGGEASLEGWIQDRQRVWQACRMALFS